MKIPRNLRGSDLIKILIQKMDYKFIHQEGSHVILETNTPHHQRIAIPDHKFLRIGTLNSILRSISNHKKTSKEDLIQLLD
ncbi:MAG: hypothetical protein ACD_79C01354G0002 [uncultured bacterium]|nr:MAG: hypothetical protein ACD_79C01354G0002 [uncultured bacterium]